MSKSTEELRRILISGIGRSMQGSYARRAPAEESLPLLNEARDGLRTLVEERPADPEAWRLLSRAEECLLHYREAIACLKKAMSLSGKREKADLKRLAALEQALGEWTALPLSAEQLAALGEYLEKCGANEESTGRSMRFTEEWLRGEGIVEAATVIKAFGERGAYTDFQVYYNVVRG